MKLHLVVISVAVFLSCSGRSTQDPQPTFQQATANPDTGYVWRKLPDSSELGESYNFQMFSFRDRILTFHPYGNWCSINGVNWRKSSLNNSLNNLALQDSVLFNGAVSGPDYFSGNIESFTFSPEIRWKNWTGMDAQWSPRGGLRQLYSMVKSI